MLGEGGGIVIYRIEITNNKLSQTLTSTEQGQGLIPTAKSAEQGQGLIPTAKSLQENLLGSHMGKAVWMVSKSSVTFCLVYYIYIVHDYPVEHRSDLYHMNFTSVEHLTVKPK